VRDFAMKKADNAKTSAKNMKRAERFNLANHGPPMTAEDEQEAKRKKLQSVAKKLEISFGFASSCQVVPSLDLLKPATTQDFAALPKTYRDLGSVAIEKSARRSPADVGDEAVYKHVIKTYVDKGLAPNFAAVADHFSLSKNAPLRMFERHSKVLQKIDRKDPWDGSLRTGTLDEKRQDELLSAVASYKGAVQKQKVEGRWKEFIEELRLKQRQETHPNSDQDDVKKLSEPTYKKILDAVLPESLSTTKQLGQGRIDAQTIPHNAISCCALVEATFNNTAKECIFSSDMFTLYIDPTSSKAELVRCPEGTLAALREQKLSPGYEERGDKLHLGKCALPTFATFDPIGDVLAMFLFFIDKNVPHPEDGKYEIYPMEAEGSHNNPIRNSTLFAAVIPYDFNEDRFMHQMWTDIILPKTETRCLCLMRMILEGPLKKIRTPTPSPDLLAQGSPRVNLANLSSSSSCSLPEVAGHAPRAQPFDVNEELRKKMLADPSWCSHLRNPVHCQDGDNPNINAIMSSEKMAKYDLKSISEICATKKFIKVRFLKWAAGCSFVQSPNDVADCHRDVKRQTGAGSAMQTVSVDMRELAGPVAKFISDVMQHGVGKGIDAARKKSMIAYAARAKAIFSRSFNVATLQEGWAACGYFPRNYRRIMSKWTGWTQLSPHQGKQILDAIPYLAEKSAENNAGRLDDSVINAKFPFLPVPERNVADLGITRDRCCQINATGYLPARNEHGAVRVEKEAKNAAKAQADAVKIPQEKVLFGPGCDMWNKQAVLVQLELRRKQDPTFNFKATSQVGVLRDLWKNCDARNCGGVAAVSGGAAANE
jgi:hypothetical protein